MNIESKGNVGDGVWGGGAVGYVGVEEVERGSG